MTNRTPVEVTTPVARLLWGSVHKGRAKENEDGSPKLIKSGADQGKPLFMFEFGVGIPKTQAHWANEPGWGQALWAEAQACWPGGQTQRPDFAFKVTDGDSQVPNKRMKKPCDQEGFAGHWVVSFSGMSAPQIFSTLDGGAPRAWAPTPQQPELIQPGDMVQVFGTISSNNSQLTAGMYFNHRAVCMRGMSPLGRISTQAPVDANVFGAGLAPGAVATPPAVASFGTAALPPGGGAAPATLPPVASPVVSPAPATLPPPAATPVLPNPAMLGAPPAAVPRSPQERMVGGASYADAIKAGWTDAMLIQHGHMTAA